MQRFLSLRLLSKNHLISKGPSSYISNTSVSLAKTNLIYTKNAYASSGSQYSTNALAHSWAKPNNFFGFLANPVLVHKVLQKSNAMLKAPSKGLLDFKRVFSRIYFLQKGSLSSSSFNPLSLARKWFQRVDPDNLILVLIAANIAIFLAWQKADRQFMIENFMVSVDNFRSGRVHTLITSAFSHYGSGHIVSNMLALYVFGTSIGSAFGPEFLLKLYLAGALAGSVFYLVYHAFLIPSKSKQVGGMSPSSAPGLGASGAVNAIMLLEIFLNPKKIIYLEFIIPVPALLAGVFLIGNDMLRVIKGDSRVSGSAHLGGAAVAAMAWVRYRKRRF